MVIEIIKKLESIQGANFRFARTDYSWQTKTEYTIQFEFNHGGDELRVIRTGQDFEAILSEAWGIFESRLHSAFKPGELTLALEAPRVVVEDISF